MFNQTLTVTILLYETKKTTRKDGVKDMKINADMSQVTDRTKDTGRTKCLPIKKSPLLLPNSFAIGPPPLQFPGQKMENPRLQVGPPTGGFPISQFKRVRLTNITANSTGSMRGKIPLLSSPLEWFTLSECVEDCFSYKTVVNQTTKIILINAVYKCKLFKSIFLYTLKQY